MMITDKQKLRNQEIIGKLTLEEKAGLCDGLDFWHTKPIERLGIPSIMVCDGPHGLRKQNPNGKKIGLGNSYPAVCFPTACTTACSWNPKLLYEMGKALAEECLRENVSVVLGPGVNMKRSPLCGRNFEYFSEDPLLAGKLSASFINGVQSMGVGTSLKHFAVNSQETRRMSVSSVVDERTLREIYLLAFEIAVKEGKPWTVMNSYNKVNGVYSAENDWLQNHVLRDEWGFDGTVVSDWGAVNDRIKGINNGNDLEMPTSNGLHSKMIVEAVKNGEIPEEVLDKRVDNLVNLINKAQNLPKKDFTCDGDEHHKIARKIAGQSMVLLKNDGILPLSNKARIAVVGEMAQSPRYQGAGSSLIHPTKLDNALDCLKEMGIEAEYARGYDIKKVENNQKLIDEAVQTAKNSDVVIAFIGLTDVYESEGFDREHMSLPDSHNALVEAVCEVNKNVVVVLAGGSPVSMPWLDKVKGLLNSYLGGQAGAGAVVDILMGTVNPSGKLAETYSLCEKCTPCANNFPGGHKTVEYRESIYIGYRYYEKVKKDVRFPFGFGLSYTQFEYSDLKLDRTKMNDDETLKVSFKIKNAGAISGEEIAQLYVSDVESTIFRPEKELKGFTKIELQPGEEKDVELELDKRAFAYYNVDIQDWHVESGKFKILVGASSADIKLSAEVEVNSSSVNVVVPDYRETAPIYYDGDVAQVADAQFEAILGFPIPPTEHDRTKKLGYANNFEDAIHTKWGRRINKFILFVMNKVNKGPNAGMMNAVALQTPFRCMLSMSNGLASKRMLDGLLAMLNDEKGGLRMFLGGIPHVLRNLRKFLKSI